MNSMTGYGKADLKTAKLSVSVAVSSVNSRFLEYSLRLPRQVIFLEPRFKELIASKVSRGKINLALNYEDLGVGVDRLSFNWNLADEVYDQLARLRKKYDLAGEVEIGHFATFPELFRVEKAEDVEAKLWPSMKRAVNRALDDLVVTRKMEGENLKKDLAQRLKILLTKIREIEKQAPKNVQIYRERLARKISQVLGEKTIDGLRLEEEIAYMAERSDITEECIRFESHLRQFGTDVKKKGPVGKKLNFILQELNRESNTLGAKAANTEVSRLVLILKEEIEKMREQVQNIE
jgi:uncharacterized protein (TIGR00255 family)